MTLLLVCNTLDKKAVAIIGIKVSSCPGNPLKGVCSGDKAENGCSESDDPREVFATH